MNHVSSTFEMEMAEEGKLRVEVSGFLQFFAVKDGAAESIGIAGIHQTVDRDGTCKPWSMVLSHTQMLEALTSGTVVGPTRQDILRAFMLYWFGLMDGTPTPEFAAAFPKWCAWFEEQRSAVERTGALAPADPHPNWDVGRWGRDEVDLPDNAGHLLVRIHHGQKTADDAGIIVEMPMPGGVVEFTEESDIDQFCAAMKTAFRLRRARLAKAKEPARGD